MNTRRLTLVTASVLTLALLDPFFYFRLGPEPTLNVQAGGGYEGRPAFGERRAPVKLISFENFLCEHCKAFEAETLGRLRRDYINTGQVEAHYVNLAWGTKRR